MMAYGLFVHAVGDWQLQLMHFRSKYVANACFLVSHTEREDALVVRGGRYARTVDTISTA